MMITEATSADEMNIKSVGSSKLLEQSSRILGAPLYHHAMMQQ